MTQYQGKDVTVIRDAQASDTGFIANTPQSLIKLGDGSQKVVPKSEVTGS